MIEPTTNPGPSARSVSGCNGGACILVTRSGDHIQISDSKNPDAAPLTYTPREWAEFVERVKKGKFDGLEAAADTNYVMRPVEAALAARDAEVRQLCGALAPVLRAAMRVDGGEHGISERLKDYEDLADALSHVPWSVQDALGIKEGDPL